MSFVRTLATLAAGFAAARGYDKYREMGGMPGVQKAMRENEAVTDAARQMGEAMERLGVPGGAEGFQKMVDQFLGQADQAGAAATAGLGSLMTALTGSAAAGAEQASQMLDAFTGKTAVSDAMEDNARLMIRAMIQAAKADGEIDAEERARIMERLGDMDPEQRAFVEAELARPVDIAGLAQEAGHSMRIQVYAMSLMAMRVDKASEAAYLDGLATALGLEEGERAAIHERMGVS